MNHVNTESAVMFSGLKLRQMQQCLSITVDKPQNIFLKKYFLELKELLKTVFL